MKRLIACLFLTTTASASFSGYSYERVITISSSNVSNTLGTLSNFPVEIVLNNNSISTTTSAGGRLNSSGMDLVFSTMSDCSFLLNWDTETVQNVGVSTFTAWVKIPTLTTATLTSATFYMCYGNPGVTTYQGISTATWDSNYVGVWHVANGTTLSAKDSTSNGNIGTITGATATTGQIDGAGNFNGSSKYIDVPTSTSLNITTSVTLEAWFFTTVSNIYQCIISRTNAVSDANRDYSVFLDGNGTSFIYATMGHSSTNDHAISTPWNLSAWNHIAVVNNAGATTFYLNGVSVLSLTLASPTSSSNDVWLGEELGTSEASNAIYDEFRISNSARSIDWIVTEYNNQNSPTTFSSIGNELTAGSGTPQIIFSGSTITSSTTAANFSAVQGQESTAYTFVENTVQEVDPAGGTWSNLYVNSSAAPGAGKSYQFIFRTNGTNSPITCTISGATATTCVDVSDSMITIPGDLVSMEILPSGTPTAATFSFSMQRTPAIPNQYILMGNGATFATATEYVPLSGVGSFTSAANNMAIIPQACTFENLYISMVAAPGAAKTYTFAYDTNQAATPSAVKCTVSGATATTCNDVVDSSITIPGAIVNIQQAETGTPISTSTAWGIVCVPTVPGQFPFIGKNSNSFTNTNLFNMIHAGQSSSNGVEGARKGVLSTPTGGLTLGNIYCRHGSAPGAGTSYAWNIRKNAATPSGSPSCIISGTATTGSDTTDTMSIANGDLVDVNLVPTATPGATGVNSVAFTGTVPQTSPAFVIGISSAMGTAGTTQSVNTVGSNFYVAAVSGASGFTPTLTDSLSNKWTLAGSTTSTNTQLNIYYSSNPLTSASYNMTLSGASFSSVCFGSFSGMNTLAPFQVSVSTRLGNGTTLTYPSITPAGASLMTAGVTVNGAENISASSGYVVGSTQAFVSGSAYGCGMNYLFTSSPNAPNWTYATNTDIAGVNAAFSQASPAPIISNPSFIIQGGKFSTLGGKVTIK